MGKVPLFQLNSLTFKLSLLFAMTALILFAGAGTFLYSFLEQELMKRDHEELVGKINLFRHRLLLVDTTQQILAAPNLFRDVIIGHPHLRLALLDDQGNTLLSSSDWKPPAALFENTVDIGTLPGHSSMLMPTSTQQYHAIAAWGALGVRHTNKVLIALALDIDEAQSLLLRYRQTLFITLFFSVLSATALAFVISRRGLRPLSTMAKTASEISATHLQKRLSVEQAPNELKTLAGAFNDMLGRLHNSFARLSDFSSDIAHELRTPINNLMGQTQVALSRARNNEEYKAVLESNLEEYERLARMIRDMLFIAQSDNTQSDDIHKTLHKEQLELSTELHKIAEFYQLLADERGLNIITSGSGTIIADRILVQRAIGNLISNAVQHGDTNSEIRLEIVTMDKDVEVRISNIGPGIPAEHINRVFDRFYRIDNARSRTDTGSGLGLAIVKSIMELHGGSVTVDSQINQITTFKLHFPIADPVVSS